MSLSFKKKKVQQELEGFLQERRHLRKQWRLKNTVGFSLVAVTAEVGPG